MPPEEIEEPGSQVFGRLHEGVQRWIWQQGWTELRDIQERSIPVLLDGTHDLVVAAATASGKTEAAFLPIVSRLATEQREPGGGFDAVYASPLRALINDQFGRIEGLCSDLGIPVTKWHADVAASIKARARQRPGGILLTTPESLEAILCRRGGEAPRLFGALSYVVVDELHAFLDQPRGRQLQSILNRLEMAAGHRTARVGLSATLADMREAAAFLRPSDPDGVVIERSALGGGELRLQLRGYEEPLKPVADAPDRGRRPPAMPDGDVPGDAAEEPVQHDPGAVAEAAIATHLFETLRGGRNLVFAGSRQRVESITAALGEMTDAIGVPDEFLAHHGSLSREIREEAERRLRDEGQPSTIVCTTTLELGIDVGPIQSVAQLGAHHRVSGMRQRIGRSGRREGQPAVMRIYVREAELDQRTHPMDALRTETVQAAAMVRLMIERWNEPAVRGRLHLSTLVHQILALVAQHGGLTAAQGWERLAASSVFPELTMPLYVQVLRRMAHPEARLLEQAPDGTLLPGPEGEHAIAARDFYAVFMTPEEYKVTTDRGRSLGMIPVDNPLVVGQLVIFGGRRWRVLEVDRARREIQVSKAYGGKPPVFGGHGGAPHDRVVEEMRRIYASDAVPVYLDTVAQGFLMQARTTFRSLGLDMFTACTHSGQLLLFPWTGNRTQAALALALADRGVEATSVGLAVAVPSNTEADLRIALRAIAASAPPDGALLARLVEDKARDKYDRYLDEELLCLDWASEHLDTSRIPDVAADILAGMPEGE
jgi:ATP-dependent Lhr-like helicase